MTSIALFNNKGGVGKTTLAYHLAHMYQRRGKRVLAVDLDPQSNLTSAFLDEDDLAFLWDETDPSYGFRQEVMFTMLSPGTPETIAQAVQPIVEGTGDVELIEPAQVAEGLWLLPGDLRTADGAMGSMQGLVEKCRSEFRDLTYAIDGWLAALGERRR